MTTSAGLPRWVEILLAGGGLLVLSPLLAVAAVAVKLSSPGPVLFRQQRIGRGGKPFTLLKFRSMRQDNRGLAITAAGDSRITAVGRWLRSSKADEFPELWNILVGEMSFVGPRPEVPRYVDPSDPRWQAVLGARPGLTDPVTLVLRNEEQLLAQVDDTESFYREVLLPYKLIGNAEYLARRTAWSDLRLIVDTVWSVLRPGRRPPPGVEEVRRVVEAS